MPDSWMVAHFGSPIPGAGNRSRATDDRDGDGLNNLAEFIIGTSPVDANSRLKTLAMSGTALEWAASPYRLYNIESSTDLISWTRFANPVMPTTQAGSVTASFIHAATERKFYRVTFAP